MHASSLVGLYWICFNLSPHNPLYGTVVPVKFSKTQNRYPDYSKLKYQKHWK